MDPMSSIRPLVRWDGAHVVLELAMVERHLRRVFAGSDSIDELELGGAGDRLRVTGRLRWHGMISRVALELGELRMRRRRLGMRVRRIVALGGIRIPRRAVLGLVERAAVGLVTIFPEPGIMILDLSRWVPEELEITVLTVQATERTLDLWLGPGSLRDLPRPEVALLPAPSDAETAVSVDPGDLPTS